MAKIEFPKISALILLLLLLLYVLFPTHNSSTDAWYYAASVKYGEDLFLPHHLFHSAFLYLCYKALSLFITVDTMSFSKAMNALFATIVMAIFARLLRFSDKKDKEIAAWTFLVGSSFAIWRYATENETYLLPLIFSLLATLYYNKNIQQASIKNTLLSGLFAAIACLFHQLQIIWALGLAISWLFKSKKINLIYYSLPFLIIPLAYFFTYHYTISRDYSTTHFMQFVLHDFHTGSASLSFGIWNIVLTILNFFRSFLQIHGSILLQIKTNYLYTLPIFLSILFIFLSSKIPSSKTGITHSARFFAYAIILALQIFFACLAMGNAEFMVMIPLLIALIIAEKRNLSPTAIAYQGISLSIWNFAYAISPQHFAKQTHDQYLLSHIPLHQQDTYLLESRPMIANQLYYHTKKWHFYHLQHAPKIWISKGQNLDSLTYICDSTLQAGGHVYTDVQQKNALLNRESIRYSENDSIFWKRYEWTPGKELNELRLKKE